jgi:hypothetical protein
MDMAENLCFMGRLLFICDPELFPVVEISLSTLILRIQAFLYKVEISSTFSGNMNRSMFFPSPPICRVRNQIQLIDPAVLSIQ